jgi:thiamine pyrophosphokinase
MDAIGKSIGAALTNTALALNQNIAAGLKNNFISPTGLVFSLNAPRYNDEFDLQMDVTYRV